MERSAQLDDDLAFLAGVPYFRNLPRDDLLHVWELCHRRVVPRGHIILHEGVPADALYIVRAGAVRVFKTSDQGHEQVLIVLGPGETFNDVPVFDGGPNPASVQADARRTSIYALPVAQISRLLATNARIQANVIRVLASRLRHMTALVENLSFHPTLQRVARLLLEESERNGGVVAMSQQEMAMRVGTAREVVSRALRELERRGAIARDARLVRVDAEAMQALLSPGRPGLPEQAPHAPS